MKGCPSLTRQRRVASEENGTSEVEEGASYAEEAPHDSNAVMWIRVFYRKEGASEADERAFDAEEGDSDEEKGDSEVEDDS